MGKRLFVDMDGTLAVFIPTTALEQLYEKGYFLSLQPQRNVLNAVDYIIRNTDIEVFILSAFLTDSKFAYIEKNKWIDQHIPMIDFAHRIFVPCGDDKKGYIPGETTKDDYLLDDYTKNLLPWSKANGTGIKLLNGINDTHKTWTGAKVHFDTEAAELVSNLLSVMTTKQAEIVYSTERSEQIMDDDKKNREIIRGWKNRQTALIATYEELFEVTNEVTQWYGDYHLYEITDGVSSSVVLDRYNRALTALGLTEQEFLENENYAYRGNIVQDMCEKNNLLVPSYISQQMGASDTLKNNEYQKLKDFRDSAKAFVAYNLDEIIKLPIEDLAEDFALKKGRDGKYSLRPTDKTPSAKIYPETNSFFDFGAGVGGGVIQLTMACMDCNKKEAIQYLGQNYNIPIIQQNDNAKEHPIKQLSKRQYELIGIQGDRAGKNYDFDFNKYTETQIARISERLAIPMNELFTRYPGSYKQIIQERAIPYVNQQRQQYLFSLYLVSKSENDLTKEVNFAFAKEVHMAYEKSYNILKSASFGTNLDIKRMQPDMGKDLQSIEQGKQSIEIGDYPYSEFKKLPGGNQYTRVSEEEFKMFQDNLEQANMTLPYTAFLQKDMVNIAYKEVDALEFNGIFKSISKAMELRHEKGYEKKPDAEYEM